jgi:UDP-N-acetylmuramoyl-tripeptide--D-alanyl-D-alanine ligase
VLAKLIRLLKRIHWYLRWQLLILVTFIWRRVLYKTTFIAITGSVGKTTTKEFLSAILAEKFSVMRTPGNRNLRRFRGLEHTILRTRPWHKFVVVEVGVEKPGDMRSAARFLKPDIVIVLDVKHCHTNKFETLDAIAAEKALLLTELKATGCAILNRDNPYIAAMEVPAESKVLHFGKADGAGYRLLGADSKWPERLTLSVMHDNTEYEVSTRLNGTHWTNTVLASMAAAHLCGVAISDVIKSIRHIEPFWGRMQPVTLPNQATIIRDDFNGSIDTFEVALRFMGEARATRKIVVFSDFSDSPKKLRIRANYVGRVAANHADAAIFVGEYAERSRRSAIDAGLSSDCVHGFYSTGEATRFLKKELRAGDLVLIKGQSNHHMSRIYLGLIGEVTCSRPTCPKQMLCDCCPELGFNWTKEMSALRAPPDAWV